MALSPAAARAAAAKTHQGRWGVHPSRKPAGHISTTNVAPKGAVPHREKGRPTGDYWDYSTGKVVPAAQRSTVHLPRGASALPSERSEWAQSPTTQAPITRAPGRKTPGSLPSQAGAPSDPLARAFFGKGGIGTSKEEQRAGIGQFQREIARMGPSELNKFAAGAGADRELPSWARSYFSGKSPEEMSTLGRAYGRFMANNAQVGRPSFGRARGAGATTPYGNRRENEQQLSQLVDGLLANWSNHGTSKGSNYSGGRTFGGLGLG